MTRTADAWFPLPSSLPKQAIEVINELINLNVLEKLNDEIRFTHEFMLYYDKVDVDMIKEMVHDVGKDETPDIRDDAIKATKMNSALTKYLNDQDIHVDEKKSFDLVLETSSLMALQNAGNELKSIFGGDVYKK
jgi:hypothetical protein